MTDFRNDERVKAAINAIPAAAIVSAGEMLPGVELIPRVSVLAAVAAVSGPALRGSCEDHGTDCRPCSDHSVTHCPVCSGPARTPKLHHVSRCKRCGGGFYTQDGCPCSNDSVAARPPGTATPDRTHHWKVFKSGEYMRTWCDRCGAGDSGPVGPVCPGPWTDIVEPRADGITDLVQNRASPPSPGVQETTKETK